jgi:hypothetical protein
MQVNSPKLTLAVAALSTETTNMKNYTKMLLAFVMATICTVSLAADKPNCHKTGKNCPMNGNKECNCGKSCDCGK